MESNAKIVVKDGNTLTINKDMIMSCDTMWDAIEVEEGASLVINELSMSLEILNLIYWLAIHLRLTIY